MLVCQEQHFKLYAELNRHLRVWKTCALSPINQCSCALLKCSNFYSFLFPISKFKLWEVRCQRILFVLDQDVQIPKDEFLKPLTLSFIHCSSPEMVTDQQVQYLSANSNRNHHYFLYIFCWNLSSFFGCACYL